MYISRFLGLGVLSLLLGVGFSAPVEAATPTVTITFTEVTNTPPGNATATTFVGSGATAFASGASIDLAQAGGTPIIDAGLVPNVPGLALSRDPGSLHVLQYGFHNKMSTTETVDVQIVLNGAHITGVRNDVGLDKTDSPYFGMVGGEDTVEVLPDGVTVRFRTIVSPHADALFIDWVADPTPSPSPTATPAPQSQGGGDSDDEWPEGDCCAHDDDAHPDNQRAAAPAVTGKVKGATTVAATPTITQLANTGSPVPATLVMLTGALLAAAGFRLSRPTF